MFSENVVILPGSVWQKKLVQYMSNFYNVYIVNPVETEVTKLGHHFKEDIYNLDVILNFCKSIDPKFIVSDQSDIATMIVAKLSETLGLRSNSVDSVKKFSHKGHMYRFAREIGVPVLDFKEVSDLSQAKHAIDQIGLPVVIKPVDSTNSRGVFKIENKSDLDFYFDQSMVFSKTKTLLIQKFNSGKYQLTVEGFCSNYKHQTLVASIKGEYWSTAITSSLKWPFQLDPSLIALNDKYVEATGLEFGITHAEYIVDDIVYLNEIGCRGGGFGISSDIVPWVTGVDLYDLLHQNILGSKKAAVLSKNRMALLKFFKDDKFDYFQNIPGVLAFTAYNAGDQNNNRGSYLIALTENQNELDFILKRVEECRLP